MLPRRFQLLNLIKLPEITNMAPRRIAELNAATKEFLNAGNVVAKVFWILVFLLCLILMLYNCGIIARDYLNYEIQTRIQLEAHSQLLFPVIAICAQVPFDPKKVHNNATVVNYFNSLGAKAAKMHKYMAYYLFHLADSEHNTLFSDIEEAELERLYRNMTNPMSNDEIREMIKQFDSDCNDLFISCRVGMTHFNCCENIVEYAFRNSAGCHLLKPPKHLEYQNIPGTRRSLKIVLTRDQIVPMYYQMITGVNINWDVYLITQDDSYSPIDTAPITLEQNTMNVIALDPSYTSILGHPYYPDCQSYPIKSPYQKLDRYNIDQCYRQCEMEHTKTHCNCVRIGFEPWPNHPVKLCTPLQTICAVEAVANITCNCYIPCRYSKSNVKINSRKFEDVEDELEEALEQDIKSGKDLNSMTSLNTKLGIELFHATLVTQHIIQSPKWSLTTALSSIGAQCAFWMGIKIITICQVFYHGFVYLKAESQHVGSNRLFKRKKNKRKTSTEPKPNVNNDTDRPSDFISVIAL